MHISILKHASCQPVYFFDKHKPTPAHLHPVFPSPGILLTRTTKFYCLHIAQTYYKKAAYDDVSERKYHHMQLFPVFHFT